MATGYVLVLAVLILGGVIATLGDRIGMRVGKARLSLFNLRPRQTATVVSILTGGVISASTLALLFGISQQLRTGVFELERIQDDLLQAEAELDEAQIAKTDIESALTDAREEQTAAQQELADINQSLQQAVEQQRTTQSELQQSRSRLSSLQSELGQVSQQSAQLQDEIQRLQTERADLLQQQATVQERIAERDRLIAERDRAIAQRESRLRELQRQQTELQENVALLERQYQGLFRGSVAVDRNEPLVSVLLRVNDPVEARRAVDQLLRQANRSAIEEIAPGIDRDDPVLSIPSQDVDRLVQRISDGQSYVVRVLSSANYIIGEPCVVADGDPCVQVFIDAAVNELIYEPGQRLAMVSVDPRNLTNQELVEKLNLLIASLQFRARQDGLVGDTLQVAEGRTEALIAFLQEMRSLDTPIDIQAITSAPIPTVGPLQVELFAVRDGEVLLRTDALPREAFPEPSSSDPPRRDQRPN
ncbi:DUF3084 domain-containing protein [Halomicronema sp. CCY15110]|uniref:DUF3084 domain-containing protein n=1 Tax=Halomicronema sp. CCY15110 TaxID=2767773 RepID=UPI00194F07BF|nr:DUF3084 domain-containing protein [Halomicronema sp. CCY15110]